MSPLAIDQYWPSAPGISAIVPAEQLAVEGRRRLDVRREQVVPGQGAGHVHEPGADVPARLPDAEDRALRVLEDREAPGVADVAGGQHHRRAQRLGARGGRVGVLDADVAVPVRRHRRIGQRQDRGHGLAVELGDGVGRPGESS